MKKSFRFLALSFALICGTLSSLAAAPAGGPKQNDGVIVGQSLNSGVVVYEVKSWNESNKAYEVEITGLNYKGLNDVKPTELEIPTSFTEDYGTSRNNYYVIKISDANDENKKAFYAHTNLEKLTFVNDGPIANSKFTINIGTYAFYGCTKLKEITLPENTLSIGEYAFQYTSVENFEIPKGTQTIGANAFYNNQSLNIVTVAAGNTKLETLGNQVFANSTLKVLDLTNASKLKYIGSAADKSPFLYDLSVVNNQLTTVKLPASVENVYNSFKNCTALTTIEGLDATKITAFLSDAFNNCQSLTQLDFPVGKGGVEMLTGTPFKGCVKLATLTFADGFIGTIGNGTDNVYGTVAADLAALKKITFKGVLYGTIAGASFGNSAAAKACSALETVEFLDVLSATGENNEVTANRQKGATINAAFQNCAKLATVTFNGVYIHNYASGTTIYDAANVVIADNAFVKTAITSLNFGDITIANADNGTAETFSIGASFDSDVLASVEFGKITISPKDIANAVTIADGAFVSKALTTFTVGDISSLASNIISFGNSTSEVVNSSNASGANTLTTVSFGKIDTDGTVTISQNAFKSTALTSVIIGDMNYKTSGSTSGNVSIAASAFENGNNAAVMTENVSLGKFGLKVSITAAAFKGPQKDGSEFNAVLGNIAVAPNTINAGAFEGPAKGTTSYELGDIEADIKALSAVELQAFKGSKDADGANNTDVTIGAYKNRFYNDVIFTNTKNVTIASWEVAAKVYPWTGLKSLKITGNVTETLEGDGSATNSIETLEIGGNVTKADAIASFGKFVRTINFSGADPQIVKYAVAASAFKKASDYANTLDPKESISVTYKCETEANYNQIFQATAFGDDNAFQNVELFTDEWAKANIWENKQITPNTINRLTISVSDVTPSAGEDIEIAVKAAKNGKYQYGKVYIPKGTSQKYKIAANVVEGKNTVNVFSGHLDVDNIYMKQVDVYEGYYWIDATDAPQVFIVRTSDMEAANVTAVAATAADIADAENVFWFAKSDAAKNCLKYANAKVVNQELQNNAEFKNKSIYVMLNPANNNLGFGQLNQYKTTADLPKNAIYVLSKTDPQAAAARLNVVFEDDTEATAINKVQNDAAEGVIYNLQGVRVSNAQKGVYIINGKKVIR